MVKKDPAFLMYSKDWLEGTMEMLPEEKGVYIDLLCHQHQKGSLPTDTKRLAKLVGLGEQEFLFIWGGIKDKFYEEGHRLYNRKMTDVITERLDKGKKNRTIGTLAAVYRLSTEPEPKKKKAKEGFDFRQFLTVENHNLTEVITEWFNKRLKSIANEDANSINSSINNALNKEIVLTIRGIGDIKILFNTNCKDWELKELVNMVKCGEGQFQAIASSKHILNNAENMQLIIQDFVNTIQGSGDYKTEGEQKKHFVNWLNKKNGTIENYLQGLKNGIGKTAKPMVD